MPTSRVWRATLLVAGLVGQVVWTYGVWRADVYDWTPPPKPGKQSKSSKSSNPTKPNDSEATP